MKEQISQAISAALQQLAAQGKIENEFNGQIQVTRTKDASHGDFATNIALVFAKKIDLAPRDLATALVSQLESSPLFKKIEVAGPGFINFFLHQQLIRLDRPV